MTAPRTPEPPARLLSHDLLETIRSRAADNDRLNRFPSDDLDDLIRVGYLRALVPAAWGGLGMSLEQVVHEQMSLAAAAPATALAVNMHLVWTGVARYLNSHGDSSLDFVLAEAAAGEIFGFGISEAGNDLVLFDSTSKADPQPDGAYLFSGRKIFTSLSPVWTRLGTMGMDTTSADAPKLVYGFVPRSERTVAQDDWDTVGMRASQSQTTVLDQARSAAEHVVRRLDPGPNLDPFILGINTSFQILLSAVYTGIGQRALELGVQAAQRRTSLKNGGRSLAADPDIRWRLADAALAHDAMLPQLEALAADVDAGIDHGPLWPRKLSGLKHRATETARLVVDQAIRASGGSSYFTDNELGRLYRDVLAGIFHPPDAEGAHATVASSLLGPASG